MFEGVLNTPLNNTSRIDSVFMVLPINTSQNKNKRTSHTMLDIFISDNSPYKT